MSDVQNLRKWRQSHDLTLADMARSVGTTIWTYRRIELGAFRKLDLRIAVKIEDVTHGAIRPRDLLTRSDYVGR